MSAAGDDEVQIHAVDRYCFHTEGDYKHPVCFTTLPRLRFGAAGAANGGGDVPGGNRSLYMTGCTDGGLRLRKKVVAWRLELDGQQPRFSVLAAADGSWLRLANPMKAYERAARTALMTAQAMHFLRRNPDAPEAALWIHLRQAFANFFRRPSEDDFKNQTSLSLMRQFAATDPVLANAEAFRAFVERMSAELLQQTVMSAAGDADVQIHAVDKYRFYSKDTCQPVCFSTLPLLRFRATAAAAAAYVPGGNRVLNLIGCTDGGLRLRKEVVAWGLELDGEQPRFSVLTPTAGGGSWLRLANPLKVYEQTARTALMMAQALHFLRRNPDVPEAALWIHLCQAFANFLPRPSEDDFKNRTSLSLMRQFAATDPVLANAEAFRAFVERLSAELLLQTVMSVAGDAEVQIHAVDKYCFYTEDTYQPVCFSTLPRLRFGATAAAATTADVPGGNRVLFLMGYTNGGLRLRKEVVAWGLELDGEQPRFSVLAPAAGGGSWLRLANPMKVYEHTARTALMTAQALHFLRRNPDVPEAALWIHLRQAFANFWPRASEDDFKNQTSLSLMRQFAATDPVLANAEAFRAFVERISAEVGGVADIVYMADDGEVIN